ncbi:flagellar basal body-associated FliL family protein [uncultured Pseudosulfitobacter sp.]|uniref:flagellar basal body-associated FliL family protein n=1 Tax=uncultured Pseudosulfitobacter sp. TaxID=2854214 RepID=UPI0030D727D3|tara:strand:- start:17741 stop:18238 length:498 start_codon:yes stop_codon:yes gene_type:complete
MIKKLLPVLLLLIGTGSGVGAGLFLRPPPPEPDPNAEAEVHDTEQASDTEEHETEGPVEREYVKLSNQFVVPIVDREAVRALMVLALSVEVTIGSKDAVYLREPKLRDSFLQVLFDHANLGGFEGEFTSANNLSVLRAALLEVAQKDMGPIVTDVLIADIGRQDY